MKSAPLFRRKLAVGFTLTEIMLVVAILALLAAIAIPNQLRARKRAQASRVFDDLRVIDNALDLYTLEFSKSGYETLTLSGLVQMQQYIKRDTPLYDGLPNDLFGNPFVVTDLQTPPKLNSATYNALSDVAPLAFWSPYYP